MTTIRVEEYAVVAITYLYVFEVDDSLPETEALAQAIAAVKRGEGIPWDSETGDARCEDQNYYDAQVVR